MDKVIGGEGSLGLKIENGVLVISLNYDGKGLDGGIVLKIDGDYFVDKLAEAVPGNSQLEAGIVAALKVAFRALKV